MFREMRRRKQGLDRGECETILAEEKRGAFSVIGDDGYPYTIPLNFYYDPTRSALYFHCARQGHKLDAILCDPKACFCVWTAGEQVPDDWSYKVKSVVVFGHASLLEDGELKLQETRSLGNKYYPDAGEVEVEIEKAFARMAMIELKVDHMTGKRVHER